MLLTNSVTGRAQARSPAATVRNTPTDGLWRHARRHRRHVRRTSQGAKSLSGLASPPDDIYKLFTSTKINGLIRPPITFLAIDFK